jgi:hydrophobe/amphiphile efflux-1 (HAE1) family protein
MNEHNEYKGLASSSIRRPVGTLMLSAVVVVLGVFFLAKLPLDLLPSIVYPQIRAGLTNRGVEPQVLEETVAKPLEAALSTTEDLIRIETDVQEGRVGVNLHFAYGTNVDFALQDASKNLDRARSSLPDEADPPTINKFDPSQSPIFDVAFSSKERDLVSLRDWVEYRLRPQLLTIGGVASVDISGGLTREVQVTLDQERLRSYGLTVSQIIDAIRQANQDVAAGRVASETSEIVGKTAGKFRTIADVRNVLIPAPGRGRVPLTEVADVQDTHREQRLWARLDGVPAVRMTVRKQPNANTVKVAEEVDAKLASLVESRFVPSDVEHAVIQNQADFIRNSVRSVTEAAILGGGLAMLVVFVFLGSLRKTFIIGLSIPLAVLATFFLMGAFKLTLNIMSLGGLALGIGLLIDNSIVILENIFRHREEGNEDAELAAHAGSHEVQGAVVASTATNLAAVVPFLLISGLAALIFRELILTISFAIFTSVFVSLTIVPMMSAQLAKVKLESGVHNWKPLVLFDRMVNSWRRGYTRYAPKLISRPWTVLAVALVLLIASYPLTKNLGNEFLPQVDDGNASVNISMPPGVAAVRTNELTLEVEEMVRQMPGVVTQFATAGGQQFGASTSESAGRGSITVVLEPARERGMSAQVWVQELQQRIDARGFPGARVFVRPPAIRGLRTNSAGAPVALTVTGDDLIELRAIGDELMFRLRGIPGLENLTPSQDEATPQLAIELDRERAAYLGLNVAQVGQTLRTALDGTVATRFASGNKEFDLRVRLPRENFTSPEDVGSVALFPGGSDGAPIYLRDVARVYQTVGPTTINRENQNRIFRLTGDVNNEVATVGEVNDSIRARMAGLPLPEGYGIIIGGEEESIRENNRQLTIVVLLAVFLVFVVMAVQYESMVNPFVILFAIPLSLIGVCVLLWATQTPKSAPVLLGIILLAGIVVNNAILLVEYAEQLHEKGRTRFEAVIESGSTRLRPILMTTLCTVFGMLPLALGLGEGSELMQPLAIAVVGGMSISTLLTLLVVPSAYLIFNGLADRAAAFLTGRRPQPKEPSSATPPRMPVEAGAD